MQLDDAILVGLGIPLDGGGTGQIRSHGGAVDWREWYGQHLAFEQESGEELTAFRPFHDDGERPSFRVNVAKGLWYCNHEKIGGNARQFAERLGVDPPSRNGGRPQRSHSRIVATYDYRDERGRVLFQVVRTLPKGFWLRRPDGKGGWLKGLGDARRVPYCLPEVLRGPDPILITEGEEDAKRLRDLGFNSTTNPMGAGRWDDQYSASLRGRAVVLLPDNDEAERAHMQQVAQSLAGVAASVRWLALDRLPPKGDVSDWLDAGGTAADLRLLAADAPEPPADPEAHAPSATVLAIYREAEGLPAEKGLALRKHAVSSEADVRIKGMLSLAESEPGIPVLPEALDADAYLLNCPNGTLDLRTGRLRPHDRADRITQVIPVAYDPAATSPGWEGFLRRIMAGDGDLIGFLQRAVGSALTGDASDQVIFILYGPGGNGKSAFLKVALGLLGDYACWTPAETFLPRQTDAIRNDLARLRGSRFVASTETEEGAKLAEGLVKRITGDTVTARFLHQEFFDFEPTFKVFLGVNHRPTIRGTGHAIWRRVRLVPFAVTIPDAEQDPWLPARLQAEELPGILNWALARCRAWQARGLDTPEAVRRATQGYRSDMDLIGAFLEECCRVGDGLSVLAKDVYAAYQEWAKEAGERGFVRRRRSGGHAWLGLSLGSTGASAEAVQAEDLAGLGMDPG